MLTGLKEIVSNYLEEQNLGAAEYAKIYSIAIRGWRQLNWDITGTVKNFRVCLDCDKSCRIPDEVLNVLDFGVDNGNGSIASFDKVDYFLPTRQIKSSESNLYHRSLGYDDYYIPMQGSLGIGSYSSVGEYKVDIEQRRIFVNPFCTEDNFILRGLTYNHVDGEYEINPFCSEALLAYITWRASFGDKRVGAGERRDLERMFYNEKSKAKLRIKGLTVQQMNKAARESVKMGIKS